MLEIGTVNIFVIYFNIKGGIVIIHDAPVTDTRLVNVKDRTDIMS